MTAASHSYELKRLRAAIKPFRLHWFSRLRSTNDHAAELRRRGELFAPAVTTDPVFTDTSRTFAARGL